MSDAASRLAITWAADGDTTTVRLAGELDIATVRQFDSFIEANGPFLTDDLVLDLTALTFLSSPGLRSIIALDLKLNEAGAALRLAGAPAFVDRLLRVAGFEHLTRDAPDGAGEPAP